MPWLTLIVLLSVASTGLSINRPVYKIVLKQKGYAQFLQYDIETPPLREFTFCTWIRIYDLSGDQSIFTYVANGNNRVVRLWLDSGGKQINISINGKVTSSSAVDISKDVWRHICLSYQSDFGAWALYMDSRLISCQASQSLYGFVLPGGGSVIIGYGTADGGASNGLEGEIFGANMILASTIERNYTIRNDPFYKQKRFHKNKMKSNSNHINYIILSDLQTGELKNNFETTQLPSLMNSTRSYIKFRTPHSFIEHDVGLDLSTRKTTSLDFPKENDFLGFSVTDKNQPIDDQNFWNLDNTEHSGKYNVPQKNKSSQGGLNTQNPVMLSEYETPPPPPAFTFLDKTLEMEKNAPASAYKFNGLATERGKVPFGKKNVEELSEVETPPPVEKNTKVYGQWTSSKFAGSVLNYLKTIQLRSREQKKVPQTIPLTKISDSFPYASDFKVTKIRPPFQFQRRNLVEKQFETSKRSPQINVQILEDDLRNNILKAHAQTQPKHVEITNRGIRKKKQEHRFYRNADSQDSTESFESTEAVHHPTPFALPKIKKQNTADLTLQTNNLLSILPFLKSLEYFVENYQNSDVQKEKKSNDMYTRSLSSKNKWHNVKSYSNDYTPREIKFDTDDGQSGIEEKIAQVNKRHPAVRLSYKHENHKLIPYKEDPTIIKGRALAMEVSNQSDYNKDSVSILKYNHGFLPGHNKKVKMNDKVRGSLKSKVKTSRKTDFNKQVKIGNALNERHVIGDNVEQNKQSFVGGNENVPDINKYRSDIDHGGFDSSVPASLGPRICRNLELYDRVLYVQPDESIDMTHILSPVRVKNIGIEFIMQNYKKCSLQESDLQNNPMLFIDWSKTPVRLFGGSYPKKTTDLCGFF